MFGDHFQNGEARGEWEKLRQNELHYSHRQVMNKCSCINGYIASLHITITASIKINREKKNLF